MKRAGSASGRSRPPGGVARAGLAKLLAGALALLTGCGQEIVPEPFQPTHAHELYTQSLIDAGLAHTALGQEWIRASSQVFAQATRIEVPFREALYADPSQAFAAGYRFRGRPGRHLTIEVSSQGEHPFRLFIDLFRLEDGLPAEHVASGSPLDQRLEFEPRVDRDYLLRLQPELLRGGRLELSIDEGPALSFPVLGHSTRSILSRFGVEREAGRRRHHGVDIFARRHTAVLAAADGRATRVDESPLGGRVIWLRDLERPVYHYYAHLETQEIETGDLVRRGQRIGTVGNSGNARSTAPHLHFGLYAREVGPVDPWDYLFEDGKSPKSPLVDLDLVGAWGRNAGAETELEPGDPEAVVAVQGIAAHTPLKIEGAVGSLYRVRLPDGMRGFVPGSAVEPLQPLQTVRAERDLAVLDSPSSYGLEILQVPSGADLIVLGQFRGFRMVSTTAGRIGWARIGF